MTKVPNIKYHEVRNSYGLRNWIEYGLKQKKNELGWADFRLTSPLDSTEGLEMDGINAAQYILFFDSTWQQQINIQ